MPSIPRSNCAQCGQPLPVGRPGPLCPKCLLGAALSEDEPLEAPAMSVAESAARFGDYELLGEIARGGMGVVWRARQAGLNRIVALKMLPGRVLPGETAVRRFKLEAEAAAQLRHASIIAIYEVGEHEGRPFYTMELAEGGSLVDWRLRKTLPRPADAARLMALVARAVHHAHERGVLHRDLKPANILFTAEGEPKVADFGLAKFTGRDATLTLSGEVLGTPSYMSPEQAAGRTDELTTASDIYSLGAILYELLSGAPPFKADSTAVLLRKIIEEEPAPLRRRRREVISNQFSVSSDRPAHRASTENSLLNTDYSSSIARDMEVICLKCLGKNPARRYPTALALAEDLERWLRHETILARPAGSGERLVKWARRRPALAALAAFSLVALALFLGQQQRHAAALRVERDVARAAQARAEATVTRQRLAQADQLLAAGRTADALAEWARVLRGDRSNHVAAARVFSVLSHRNFVLPWPGDARERAPAVTLEFSPDGRRVLSFLHEPTVVLDAATWQPTGVSWKSGAVRAVWSADGERLALVESAGVRVWNSRDASPLLPLLPLPAWKVPVFSSDGRWLVAAGGEQPDVAMQDLATGAVRRWVEDGETNRQAATSGQAGRRLFVAARAGWKAWDLSGGVPAIPSGAATNSIRRIRFTRGVPVAFLETADDEIQFAHEETLEPVWPGLKLSRAIDDHFSPNGLLLATAQAERWGQLWDLPTGQPFGEPVLRACPRARVRFDPDGQRLWVFGDDEGVHPCDARDGTMRSFLLRHDDLVTHAEFSRDGRRIVTASRDGTARVWDATSGVPLTVPLAHPGRVRLAQFSANGARIVTLATDNRARVWDAATGALVAGPLVHPGFPHGAILDPTGSRLVMFGEGGARLHDLGGDRREPLALGPTGKSPCAQFSDDGGSLLTVVFQPEGRDLVQLWTPGEPQPRRTIEPGVYLVRAALSADCATVAIAGADATVQLWDAHTGQPMGQPMRHKDSIWAVAFSPDGKVLLSAGADRTARLWDARTGEPLGEPLWHASSVWQAQFSRDGRRVLTQTKEDFARVWDVATGLPLTEPLGGHPVALHIIMSPSTPARFSVDGQRVVLPCADNAVRLVELPPQELPPPWLAELIESVAGQRLEEHGPVVLPWSDLLAARAQLERANTGGDWLVWARWLFADRFTRTLTPFATNTVADYVAARVGENTVPSLLDAAHLQPTNPVVLERLADHWSREVNPEYPGRRALAEHLRHRAAALATGPAR